MTKRNIYSSLQFSKVTTSQAGTGETTNAIFIYRAHHRFLSLCTWATLGHLGFMSLK